MMRDRIVDELIRRNWRLFDVRNGNEVVEGMSVKHDPYDSRKHNSPRQFAR